VQVGYQAVAANFFYYALVIFLMILISETLGMLFAGAFRAELTGSIVLQAVYVPLLMFVGFFQVRSHLSDARMCLRTLSSMHLGLHYSDSRHMKLTVNTCPLKTAA